MQRTLIIPIEQDPRFDDLLDVWRRQIVYCSRKTVEIGSYSMLKLQKAVYRALRDAFPEYTSSIIVNAYKFASEAVKGCIRLCRDNKRTKFPDLSEVDSVHLRKEDLRFNGDRIRVIYKPGERIEVKAFLSEKQKAKLEVLRAKGGRLVRRDGRWMLHLIVEKEVSLPRWEWCRSLVGVDIGMNYLAVATAITEDGKVHAATFFKGGEWRHLQLKKRAKMRRLQSRGSYTRDRWTYYNRRFDEILHKAAKRVVEYAKQFEKPIIVLEALGNMRNGSRSHKWNFLLGNWQRSKLQEYITYKAVWEGIPVVHVNPAYTSQTCFYCGARGGRKGIRFECPGCGRILNADVNASVNIALRFAKNIRHPLATLGIPRGPSVSGEGDAHMPTTGLNPTCTAQMNLMRKPEEEPCSGLRR